MYKEKLLSLILLRKISILVSRLIDYGLISHLINTCLIDNSNQFKCLTPLNCLIYRLTLKEFSFQLKLEDLNINLLALNSKTNMKNIEKSTGHMKCTRTLKEYQSRTQVLPSKNNVECILMYGRQIMLEKITCLRMALIQSLDYRMDKTAISVSLMMIFNHYWQPTVKI